jgi:predicted ArsR family transcriptional regulator
MAPSESKQIARGTRDRIIRALKTNPGATVLELAEIVGISSVTVRHHLNSLGADKLVEARAERRSVGRPHHVFYLTDAGEELFPRQYLGLAKRLLEQIKTSLPPEEVSRLFEEMADEILEKHRCRFEKKSQAERMAVLAEILEEEGFLVTWEEHNGEVRLIEHNCPYRNLGRQHPDICTLDHALITRVLDSPAEKISCLLQGDQRCAYEISVPGDE